MALRYCAYPGCPRLVERGRCDKHATGQQQAADRARGSASERGYGAAWRKLRLAFLAQYPLCRACQSKGMVTPAVLVDHIVPKPKGTDDWDNLQSLCVSCHRVKSITEGRPATGT